MKYRHYAPRAEMYLVDGEASRVVAEINRLTVRAMAEGKKVGILATAENLEKYCAADVKCIGSRADESRVAHNLFALLREFDADQVDVIYAEAFPESDMGLAIMNRMNKAAGYHHIRLS